MHITAALSELAAHFGIEISYENAFGEVIKAEASLIMNVLNMMGVDIKSIKQAPAILKKVLSEQINKKLNPVNVFWEGIGTVNLYLNKEELTDSLRYEITLEDNSIIQNEISLAAVKAKEINHGGVTYFEKIVKPPKLPLGYHHITIYLQEQKYTAFILSAPKKLYTDNIEKDNLLGIFSPMYALHDKQSLGCGDLGTLGKLAQWLATVGVEVVATMPFFASFLNELYEPSPYSPMSRLFWNELYLDLKQINALPKKIPTNFQKEKLISYKEVACFKRDLIEQHINTFLSDTEQSTHFQEYLAEHPELIKYALFRAKNESGQGSWLTWEESEKKGDIALDNTMINNYFYHLFSQWKFVEQLKKLKKKINEQGQFLYSDLPIGVHKEGFDVWRYQDDFIIKATIGSPPDPVYKKGQNWNVPPLNPHSMRTNNYTYFIKLLRGILPYVDILRIDHVIGFTRLYWIPEKYSPEDGIFVTYKTEELYAILCIESNRYKTTIVGENLGLVPISTNKMMKNHGMLQMHIMQYLLDSKLSLISRNKVMLASLNTHDMPTFFSYCHGEDLKQNYHERLINEESYKNELKLRKKNISKLKKVIRQKKLNTEPLFESSLILLALSPANILIVNIEDLWSEVQAQNIPSSQNETNWARKLAYSLDEITRMPTVNGFLKSISKIRKNKSETNPLLKKTGNLLNETDLYLFNEGTHYRLYEHLGAHLIIVNGNEGINFSVWAPNAQFVSVIGVFNNWNKLENPMTMINDSGIWEVFIPYAKVGDLYKYNIESNTFRSERADPFAFYSESAPNTASVIYHSSHQWQDEQWMNTREKRQHLNSPISIYEVHFGSWRRVPEEGDRFLTYREMAPLLTEYLLAMNFTHVEFLPLMEHPFYGSWGYQTLGYFAPSARYGTPDDFKFLIDYLHQHQIGVILDWVPSHFPNDLHGLAYFDGTHLYEHADPKKGFHPDWKSAIFNYGRNEVKAFLISSAVYWLDKFHIDAIRVDAVASMLYLNYSRSEGEWIPNIYGGNENIEAVVFLKELNEVLYKFYPDIQTIAEESTAWSGVSRPTYLGGLGFGLKWDMGWMHDTLSFLNKDPIHRCFHPQELSFRMIYAFTENFVLSLSHDEVVHGKGSLINKMPGDEWNQFANLRLLYGYMFAMPGKKLLFMGNEFAQRNEWNHDRSIDWHLLQYDIHNGVQQWISDLNLTYQKEPALYQLDNVSAGFEWIDNTDSNNCVFSFLRKSVVGELILIVLNCTPISRSMYRIGVPCSGTWDLLLSSDSKKYGGAGRTEQRLYTEEISYHYKKYSLTLEIPGLSVVFYKCI